MTVTFKETYLQELYVSGKTCDKKHRFQPQIITKYVKVVNLMKLQENVLGLTKYGMAERNESFMEKLRNIRHIAAVF